MKTKFFVIFTVLFALFIFSNCKSTVKAEALDKSKRGSINLTISGIGNKKGAINIAIFDESGKEGFTTGFGVYTGVMVAASIGDTVSVTLPNLPYGKYAIIVLHDENENGKPDKLVPDLPEAFFWVPTLWPMEGYGVSNTNRPTLGPPSFEGASFLINKPTQDVEVKLYYFWKRYGWLTVVIPTLLGAL